MERPKNLKTQNEHPSLFDVIGTIILMCVAIYATNAVLGWF